MPLLVGAKQLSDGADLGPIRNPTSIAADSHASEVGREQVRGTMHDQTIYFTNVRGEKLAGLLRGDPTMPMVIACHGMLSDKGGDKHRMLADTLAEQGIATLRFDFSGRGESEGALYDMTYSRQVEDLDAAIGCLVSRGWDRFGVYGSSMGGAVALLTAARDERIIAVATLAAVAHPAALEERYPQAIGQWTTQGFLELSGGKIGIGFLEDARTHDVVSAVSVLRAPILVVHGEEDEVVPVADAHDIATSARCAALELVAGADHQFSDLAHRRTAMRQIAAFLAQHVRHGA